LDVMATLPGSGTPELVALHSGAMPVAARLGPVLFTPSLTGASHDGALPDGMPAQVRSAFDNLERLMEQSGVGQGQLLRIAGYMRDLKDKDLLNEEMMA